MKNRYKHYSNKIERQRSNRKNGKRSNRIYKNNRN